MPLSEIISTVLRTLIIYGALILAMRLGGKRQIGELQISELTTAVLLSEIAASPIVTPDTPLLRAIIPVFVLVIAEILVSRATTKSSKLKKLLAGKPSIIINKGKLNIGELSKLRLSVEELISECRQAGYSDISDIEYAILEENGKLSVFQKAEKGETERGIAHTVIVDGTVSETGLAQLGWTEEKLASRLASRGLSEKDVFVYTVNDAGEEYLIKSRKNKKRKKGEI